MYAHILSGWEAKEHQPIQRTLHPVCDRDSLSLESSAQLLRCQVADNDTRYSDFKCLNQASYTFLCCFAALHVTFFFFLVLQGVDDASCAGLKNLLLGAINKCLHNTKDAIQVLPCLINTMYRAWKYEALQDTRHSTVAVGLITSILITQKSIVRQ